MDGYKWITGPIVSFSLSFFSSGLGQFNQGIFVWSCFSSVIKYFYGMRVLSPCRLFENTHIKKNIQDYALVLWAQTRNHAFEVYGTCIYLNVWNSNQLIINSNKPNTNKNDSALCSIGLTCTSRTFHECEHFLSHTHLAHFALFDNQILHENYCCSCIFCAPCVRFAGNSLRWADHVWILCSIESKGEKMLNMPLNAQNVFEKDSPGQTTKLKSFSDSIARKKSVVS